MREMWDRERSTVKSKVSLMSRVEDKPSCAEKDVLKRNAPFELRFPIAAAELPWTC